MRPPAEAAAQHPRTRWDRRISLASLDTDAALHDPRTGLATAALLVNRLDHAFSWRSTPPLALLALTLRPSPALALAPAAHQALVRRVSRRLATSLRSADTAAAAEGDLFLVLLFDIGSTLPAARVAQRLLDDMRARASSGEALAVPVGVALTGACAPQSSAVRLLDDAMAALAVARADGASHVHVLPPHTHTNTRPADSAQVRRGRAGVAPHVVRSARCRAPTRSAVRLTQSASGLPPLGGPPASRYCG